MSVDEEDGRGSLRVLALCECFSCRWTVGMSTYLLIVSLSMLCHASLNSRACFVRARPSSSVCVQLNV